MSEAAPTADVVEAYARPSLGAPTQWDEMVDPTRGVRETWRDVGSVLRLLGPAGLADQRRTVTKLLAQDGVTYRPHGSDLDQPWALDPVPMLLDEADWARLEPALVQRTELLDLILTDLYGPRRLLAEGLIPPEIVFGHEGFIRAVDQIRLPSTRQLFLGAADLARGPDGAWTIISDRTQAPSGTGYAMANRRVVSRALPGLYRDTRIQRIGPFFQAMRLALQALAPTGSEVPRIVLLTSGAGSETSFDQAFLSSLLGFPLVEGSDLVVRDGHVWQRSIGRLAPVDVILRRVDAWFCDPLELRPESQLGIPGLVEASRLGNVSVVNGLGTGVLENPALYPYLPRLSEVLLGQPLALPSVQTWWCGTESGRSHVLANLRSLVIKPVSRAIVNNSRFGWELTLTQLDDLRRRILADPGGWVGQEALQQSTAPGVGANGLEPRPVSLRSFSVSDGGSYRVMPGGLSRIAPRPGEAVGTAASGSQSKDVWVLSSSPVSAAEGGPSEQIRGQVAAAVSPRVAETLFWLGRYCERAEAVSRLIAVTDNRWHDVHLGVDPAVPDCVAVLARAVLAVTAPWPPLDTDNLDSHTLLATVVGDASRTGTLAHDVQRVRELANASRDQLSTDTWSVFGNLDRVLEPFTSGRSGDIAASMGTLRTALIAFAGLAAESMVRDYGWHFMDAGRRIERALQIARLLQSCLSTKYPPTVATLVEESTLIAAESIITHRRRYPAQSSVDTVLELLLIDRDNPRSVAFQLDRLSVDLRRLTPTANGDDPLDEQLLRTSARLLAVDCTALAEADDDNRRLELHDLLATVIDELHQLAVAVEQTHFAHLGTLRQLTPLGVIATLEASA